MTLAREARGERDLRQAELAMPQLLLGAFDAEAKRERMRRLTRRHPEHPSEVIHAHAYDTRELHDPQRSLEISSDEILDAREA